MQYQDDNKIVHIELGNGLVGAVSLPPLSCDHAEWVVMDDNTGKLVAAGKARDADHAKHLMQARLARNERKVAA